MRVFLIGEQRMDHDQGPWPHQTRNQKQYYYGNQYLCQGLFRYPYIRLFTPGWNKYLQP